MNPRDDGATWNDRSANGSSHPPSVESARGGRSIGDLFGELTRETSALVRAEMALARSEMGETLSSMQKGATSIAAGTVALHAGALALVACLILALSQVWEPWAAALVVGLAVAALGGALIAAGRSKLKAHSLKPKRTVASLQGAKETVHNATDAVKSLASKEHVS